MATIVIGNKEFTVKEYNLACQGKEIISSGRYDSWQDNLLSIYLFGQIAKAQKDSKTYNKVYEFFQQLDCYIEMYPNHAVIQTANLSNEPRVTVRGYDSDGNPKYEFAVPSGIRGNYKRVYYIEDALEMIRHQ